MPTPKYIAFDLETTGLDTDRDRILELATVVLDDRFGELGERFTARFYCPPTVLAAMHPIARDMHLATGLLAYTEQGDLFVTGTLSVLAEVEAALIGLAPFFPEKPILLGAGPHFDRALVRRWLGGFDATLHHRHLDHRPIQILIGDLVQWPERSSTEVEHTALGDVLHSIEVCRAADRIVGELRAYLARRRDPELGALTEGAAALAREAASDPIPAHAVERSDP